LPGSSGSSCYQSYDYAFQFTSVVNSHFYHPGDCAFSNDYYFGWIGINSRVIAPSHFPSLSSVPQDSHSLGWIGVEFSDGGWIQIGWIAGCIAWSQTSQSVCALNGLKLYDEELNHTSPTCNVQHPPDSCYGAHDLGALAYNSSDIYEIYYVGNGCWRVNKNYNVQIPYSPFCGFPGSGTMLTVAEVADVTPYPPGPRPGGIEMPVTTFGYSSPRTNDTLRIQGANGFVDWTNNLSSYYTSWYDERNCPDKNLGCTSGPYYFSLAVPNYEVQTSWGGT
jgi:hypothetical protein